MLRIVVLSVLLALGCSSQLPPGLAKADLRILFIGNSLTYSNRLPELVGEMGAHAGANIQVSSIAEGGSSLEDHWNRGEAALQIKQGQHHFVVAQQGPSALPESQALLLRDAEKFAELCQSADTKLALYMVWPSKDRFFDFENVIRSYSQAAQKTNSLLAPAGLAWKYAWQIDKSLPLYSPDNFHPSIHGSVLAALTIYGAVTNTSSFEFLHGKKCSWSSQISKGDFEVLAKAAKKALADCQLMK